MLMSDWLTANVYENKFVYRSNISNISNIGLKKTKDQHTLTVVSTCPQVPATCTVGTVHIHHTCIRLFISLLNSCFPYTCVPVPKCGSIMWFNNVVQKCGSIMWFKMWFKNVVQKCGSIVQVLQYYPPLVWHTMVSNHSFSMVPSRAETPAVSVLVWLLG